MENNKIAIAVGLALFLLMQKKPNGSTGGSGTGNSGGNTGGGSTGGGNTGGGSTGGGNTGGGSTGGGNTGGGNTGGGTGVDQSIVDQIANQFYTGFVDQLDWGNTKYGSDTRLDALTIISVSDQATLLAAQSKLRIFYGVTSMLDLYNQVDDSFVGYYMFPCDEFQFAYTTCSNLQYNLQKNINDSAVQKMTAIKNM